VLIRDQALDSIAKKKEKEKNLVSKIYQSENMKNRFNLVSRRKLTKKK
jgi:hypothetical protein